MLSLYEDRFQIGPSNIPMKSDGSLALVNLLYQRGFNSRERALK